MPLKTNINPPSSSGKGTLSSTFSTPQTRPHSHKQPHHPYSPNFHHNQNKNQEAKLNPPTNQQEPYYAKTPSSQRLPLNYLKGKIKPKTTKQAKEKTQK
jgi:hypothetical protein